MLVHLTRMLREDKNNLHSLQLKNNIQKQTFTDWSQTQKQLQQSVVFINVSVLRMAVSLR